MFDSTISIFLCILSPEDQGQPGGVFLNNKKKGCSLGFYSRG